ncbi:MAG TPA: CusA/CzcA family heavy metal efflux RND transporter [Bryobacteraceae bacterium]|nr:CusA/CzcA family heavy metal efflux RND transporter [Bryobacteraceae bacterium]HPU73697.1 CusA/CzcA family heavy metal efflux RND transporter [Bryobacteraceae bacterium]
MIERIVSFSIEWRALVVLVACAIAGFGLYSAADLPIDAVPDITSNQVQINAVAPSFTPLEMEQYVTFPIELSMAGLPGMESVRSLSKFGLSQVTVTFKDDVDIYFARQLVLERLIAAEKELPAGITPEIAPVSTGLGEIYQFTVENAPDAPQQRSLMELRTILDWFIKPQLRTVPGVIEVNSFGGEEKQYQVLVDPNKLVSYGISLAQVIEALEKNNANAGGAYIEHAGEQQLLRGVGLIQNERDIENIVVASRQGTPIFVRNIGEVSLGAQVRQGAATRDGKGETVMGMAMMLKGENSRAVAERVEQKLKETAKALPPGVVVSPFYNRRDLVDRTVATAVGNLVEGGLIVMAVLFLFLLQLRAGLIVSSAIPLSMLVAIIAMKYFGVSANLMSLGAIDFGLIVDAAVIIIENCVRRLAARRRELGRMLSRGERIETIRAATLEVRRASQFGEIIIIAAYLPVLALVGIEGKMFRPMALTVVFALSGALILSLTVIPALAALFLREPREAAVGASGDKHDDEHFLMRRLTRFYDRILKRAMHRPAPVFAAAAVFVAASFMLFFRLGSDFIPDLDEGAIAINTGRLPSVSLPQAVKMLTVMEQAIKELPEVETVTSRIGRPEIATDPMGPEHADTYVFLKPKKEWKTARTQEDIVQKISEKLKVIPGMSVAFSQPIKFRMNELIEGVGARSDVVVKIFGDDLELMREKAEQVARILSGVPGAADTRVQQVSGLPVLQIKIDRDKIARYGINVSDVQQLIQSAIAGSKATTVLEGLMRFDLVVRLPEWARKDAAAIGNLLVSAPGGQRIPLSELTEIVSEEGPAEISRENGQRRISVEVNARGRDLGSFVAEAQQRVAEQVVLPPGYVMTWGGTFQNLKSGRLRLMVAVPVTFMLVFLLLFATFKSMGQATLIFTGIPFAVTGGILALWLRGMHFSMSAGIGFIAVSGVAVLNGVVMVAFINQLRERGAPLRQAIMDGAITRLRPVLMTALVASLGFLPMAISTSPGAEVQKPLATVVIGGLATSTLLTLVLLPLMYRWLEARGTESA